MVTAAGMGMVTAPSTGAIIVSLPLNKAGVGSAVNDTTRELGGSLGVAVVGSIVASLYRGSVLHSLAASPATHAATASLGAALQTARTLPRPAGDALAAGARQAYVHAFDTTMVVSVAIALFASGLVAWLLRPQPVEHAEDEDALAVEAA